MPACDDVSSATLAVVQPAARRKRVYALPAEPSAVSGAF